MNFKRLKYLNLFSFSAVLVFMALALTAEAADSYKIEQEIAKLSDKNKEVRLQAIQSLWDIGKDAVPYLLKTLEKIRHNTSDANIYAVIFTLGQIHDKSAVPALYELVGSENGNVGIAATEALCRMGDEAIVYDLMKFAVRKAKEADGSPEAAKLAKEYNEQNSDGMMRLAAIADLLQTPMSIAAGISNIGEPIIPTLLKALKHKDYEVRLLAVTELGSLAKDYSSHKKTIIESLTEMSKDENPDVRNAASDALAYMTK